MRSLCLMEIQFYRKVLAELLKHQRHEIQISFSIDICVMPRLDFTNPCNFNATFQHCRWKLTKLKIKNWRLKWKGFDVVLSQSLLGGISNHCSGFTDSCDEHAKAFITCLQALYSPPFFSWISSVCMNFVWISRIHVTARCLKTTCWNFNYAFVLIF